MREYKLNKDKKDTIPSDEAIKKHKNFNDLRVSYDEVKKRPREPLYKNRKLFMLLLLIGLTIWMMYEYADDSKEEEKEPVKTEEPQ